MLGISVGAVNKIIAEPPLDPVPSNSVATSDEVPDEIPEDTDLSTVDKWIPRVEKLIAAAEAGRDFGAASSLIAKLHSLLEHKRKASPPPKADPNENPDFIEAARRAKERL